MSCLLFAITANDALCQQAAFVPDLSFEIACGGVHRDDIERQTSNMLSKLGFRVLNKGRVQREHGVFLLPTDIVALDADARVVEVRSSAIANSYVVALRTPPPTIRQKELELKLITFYSENLGCNVARILRRNNDKDRARYHEDTILRIEKLFQQEKRLKGERDL